MLGQRIALAVEASVIELPMHRPQAQRHHPALPRTDGAGASSPYNVTPTGEQEAVRRAHNLSAVQSLAIRLVEEHFRLPGRRR